MIYNSIICLLDNVAVSTISGNEHPCGIWDWKIIWPLWNAIKFNKPKKVMIISNDDCIKKGIIQDDSYWSKICFISHCFRDYTKINYVDYSYSRNADWLDINGDILSRKAIDGKTLFIGKSEEDENFAKNQLKEVDYINIDTLINLVNEKRTADLFQRGLLC